MPISTSSFVVFMKFISYREDGTVDVNRVFSEECYSFWLSTRSMPPKRPEESFRKAITSHCRGVDGRKPFPKKVESALLKEMRKKQVWPCFEGTSFNIGKRGYQVRGFWEAAEDFKNPEGLTNYYKRKYENANAAKNLKRFKSSADSNLSSQSASSQYSSPGLGGLTSIPGLAELNAMNLNLKGFDPRLLSQDGQAGLGLLQNPALLASLPFQAQANAQVPLNLAGGVNLGNLQNSEQPNALNGLSQPLDLSLLTALAKNASNQNGMLNLNLNTNIPNGLQNNLASGLNQTSMSEYAKLMSSPIMLKMGDLVSLLQNNQGNAFSNLNVGANMSSGNSSSNSGMDVKQVNAGL